MKGRGVRVSPFADLDDVGVIRAYARQATDTCPDLRDDAMQEGLIGWWEAWEKRPGDGGYAFGAARNRITSYVTGHSRPFGAPPRQGRRQVAARLLYANESLDRPAPSDVEAAAIAYHRPEIRAAVERLTPRQREVVEKVALGLPLTSSQRGEWSGRLRPRLAEELAHLRGLIA